MKKQIPYLMEESFCTGFCQEYFSCKEIIDCSRCIFNSIDDFNSWKLAMDEISEEN